MSQATDIPNFCSSFSQDLSKDVDNFSVCFSSDGVLRRRVFPDLVRNFQILPLFESGDADPAADGLPHEGRLPPHRFRLSATSAQSLKRNSLLVLPVEPQNITSPNLLYSFIYINRCVIRYKTTMVLIGQYKKEKNNIKLCRLCTDVKKPKS